MNKLLSFVRRGHPGIEALSASLDGQLDPRAGGRLRAHVASCPACRSRLSELRATRDVLRTLAPAEAPRSFRLPPSAARAPAPASTAPGWLRPAWQASGALTVGAVLALASVAAWRSTRGPAPVSEPQARASAAATPTAAIGNIPPDAGKQLDAQTTAAAAASAASQAAPPDERATAPLFAQASPSPQPPPVAGDATTQLAPAPQASQPATAGAAQAAAPAAPEDSAAAPSAPAPQASPPATADSAQVKAIRPVSPGPGAATADTPQQVVRRDRAAGGRDRSSNVIVALVAATAASAAIFAASGATLWIRNKGGRS